MLLACSGGADSTFLARAWCHAAKEADASGGRGLPQALVVVVDHGHRAGSAADAEQAVGLYAAMGLPVHLERLRASSEASEAALRTLRYASLRKVAEEIQAACILMAHHADDQAETLLLRIFRGTGLNGLCGMPARRHLAPGLELLRPLLDFRVDDLRRTLQELGQAWIEDPTNADPTVAARNHLRREVLPCLGPLASAEPTGALLRLAREAESWREARDQLLAAAPDWQALPTYLRRCAIQDQLQALGETVSPARLRDLEGALLKRARAGIDGRRVLELRDGRLRVESRTAGEADAGTADGP